MPKTKATATATATETEQELRTGLRQMINAAQGVLDNWSEGDLAGAVNILEDQMRSALQLLGHSS